MISRSNSGNTSRRIFVRQNSAHDHAGDHQRVHGRRVADGPLNDRLSFVRRAPGRPFRRWPRPTASSPASCPAASPDGFGIDQHHVIGRCPPRELRRIASRPSTTCQTVLPGCTARCGISNSVISGWACTCTVTYMPRTSAGGPTGPACPSASSSHVYFARIGDQHAARHGARSLVDADAVEPRQHAFPQVAPPGQFVARP